MIDLDSRFALATGLVAEAGDLALGYFNNRSALAITQKGLQDMASQADVEVEKLIRARLAEAFPGDGFLGEETGRATLGDPDCIWVVDPIDGTQPFVHGLTSWCVSIGLVARGRIEMGFVTAPARGETFIGRRGSGATRNGVPIHVKDAASVKEGMLGVGYSPRVPTSAYIPFFERILTAGGIHYRDGSGALSLCYVADGRLIGYVEPHINSWDCLGAIAVIEAAGGRANAFLADDGLWKGNPVVAAGPKLYPALEALLTGNTGKGA